MFLAKPSTVEVSSNALEYNYLQCPKQQEGETFCRLYYMLSAQNITIFTTNNFIYPHFGFNPVLKTGQNLHSTLSSHSLQLDAVNSPPGLCGTNISQLSTTADRPQYNSVNMSDSTSLICQDS